MIQFLNNIWIALSTKNTKLITVLSFFMVPLENFLTMNLFLSIFGIKASSKSKIIYISCISIVSFLASHFIKAPLNILLNYTCIFVLIKLVFKLNVLKSFMALMLSTFIYGLLNLLLEKPYLRILNISANDFLHIPIYRIPYVMTLYILIYVLGICIRKFYKCSSILEDIDSLDIKTKMILLINLGIGLSVIVIQLIITTFYIETLTLIITILNFILLILFFVLSLYSFSHIIKLYNTKKDLQSAEEYNKSLEILYDKVKGFKHDFDNIVSTINGFIENNDMDGLKLYFEDVKKDCKITNNLSLLNPRIINNPGIYSLLNNKYFKATNAGIKVDFYFFLDLNTLPINTYKFSRILGILLDNAIEEAEKCENKILKVSFRREHKNNRAIILIENTYSNKNVNIDEIFKKGISGKENHSGIGLWEVKNYVKRSKNLDLFTSKNNKFFKQELDIYDIENVSTAN